MKKLHYLLLLLILFSCKKENDGIKSDNNTGLFVKILSGNEQIGYSFQELDQDIVISIKDKDSIPYCKANFKYLINSGNGLVCNRHSSIKGEYRFRWLLSCNVGTQSASILIFDSINRIVDTLKLTATAKICDKWNRSCGLTVDSCSFSFDEIKTIISSTLVN